MFYEEITLEEKDEHVIYKPEKNGNTSVSNRTIYLTFFTFTSVYFLIFSFKRGLKLLPMLIFFDTIL